MTREEAIKIIDCYDIGFYDLSGAKIPADKLADAFDMAIEALKGGDAEIPNENFRPGYMQQCPTDGADLISRADAIEAMCNDCGADNGDFYPNCGQKEYCGEVQALLALPSAEAKNESCDTCKYYETSHEEYPCSDCTFGNSRYVSAKAVSEDTQSEERARFVAKETELAHIEAKLENAEKRLQGACTANFVAEQLDHLRNMTDEERWNFFIRFFSPNATCDCLSALPSAEAEWIPCSERLPERSGAYLVWMQWPCDEEPTASIINYDADCEMFGEWHELYHPITLGYLDSDFDEIKGVIAWMPLPKPYREDGEA